MFGLSFKGFFVVGLDDPSLFNGHKYYNAVFSDGVQDYNISLGQDGRGQVISDSLVLFDKLYDGFVAYKNEKLVLDSFSDSKESHPVPDLSFSGLRVSSITDYVHVSSDGVKYYSANFTDGKKPFRMSLGAEDDGLKLRDSLVLRTVPYDGTVHYADIRRKDDKSFRILMVTSLKPQVKK